jgi:NAD(P)-dependent dehydrogenase (short-subunit alcohol dehydrogenase family)
MDTKQQMAGKVALITGASSGIGKTTAFAFAQRGAKVIVNANSNVKGGEEVANKIIQDGGEARFFKANVSKAVEVEAMVKFAVDTFGHLDYAFNNAGVEGTPMTIPECTEEEWDNVISINLKGVWLCMKYELTQMLKQGKGAIVNTSSVSAIVTRQLAGAYTASKYGILGLTKTGAVEFAKQGIRVNVVCPGFIHTEMVDRVSGGNLEMARIAQRPIERLGEPEEVANTVVWLCSDEASFINGQTIAIDGGKSIFSSTPARMDGK